MQPPPTPMSRADYLGALCVVLIWGVNFVVMKIGLQGLHPMLLGALRFALASLPFVVFVRRPDLPWRFVVGYGLVQGVGQFGLLFLALAHGMPAGMASVVLQLQAFVTLLLAAPLLGERARVHQWCGLVFAAAGLLLIGSATGAGPGQIALAGLLLTVGAACMWAVSNLVVRLAGRHSAGYDPFAFIVWTSLVPVLPFFGLAAAAQGVDSTVQQLAAMGLRDWLAVLFLAWLATALGYSLWTRLLKRHPAGRIAPFSLLVPPVGLLSAFVVFGERLTPLQWTGTACVLAGLLVNQLGGRLVDRLRGQGPQR